MWAVVDANSYFCSVEKVFHPGLNGKAVCVLSSNDGIIVALTPEAKALGLRRGDPLFKVRDIVERKGVAVFSSNMTLYAAMSQRVQNIIRQSVEYCEVYSIDEVFCSLSGYGENYDLEEYMRNLADKVRLWTDIPVSVGVAPTKTLSKIASKFAKNYPGYRSVCIIDNDNKRRKALAALDLNDVWGLGRRSCEKLKVLGVNTPLEFADKNAVWVRRHFSLPVIRTWKELNGYPCIDTTEILQKQSITTSRSFGMMISSNKEMKASVANFAASCANKLRAQKSVAGTITVFLCSNAFREDLEQYANSGTYSFQVRTSDTIEITEAALQLTDRLFKPGIQYKKSGVILGDIIPENDVQQDIFDPVNDRTERLRLSRTIDRINVKYGLKTIGLAAEGSSKQSWKVKCAHKSPDYLTNLDDILTISI